MKNNINVYQTLYKQYSKTEIFYFLLIVLLRDVSINGFIVPYVIYQNIGNIFVYNINYKNVNINIIGTHLKIVSI